MAEITITTARGEMNCYLATPTSPGPWPAVVVIHDALGYTVDVRTQADWLAKAGYLALAPNLYYFGEKRFACMRSVFNDIGARRGPAFDDIEAARVYLSERSDCTDRIGVIGYCMGGGFSLLLAPHRFNASSVNYGAVPRDMDHYLRGACPIVGSFGKKDRSLRGAAKRLEDALQKARVPYDIKEYPNAGHSFLNEHSAADRNLIFVVLGRLIGNARDEAAAQDARKRIIAFFDKHLKN